MTHQLAAVTSVLVALIMAATRAVSCSHNLVPSQPFSLTRDTSSLYNIWSHALRNQKDDNGQLLRDDKQILTILNPDYMRMVNLVPQDAPHPLYSDKHVDLRTEFLKDYMFQEAISPTDPRMSQPGGLTVNNLNGKPVTFKINADDKINVSGVDVTKVETLEGGLVSYTLEGFLFDHQARVDSAFEQLSRSEPSYGAFGEPLEPQLPH